MAGTSTPDYARLLESMGSCHVSQGHYKEAMELYMEAKTAYEAAQNPGGPLVRLENVIAKNVNVRSLVPMKKLHSTTATTVRVLAEGKVLSVVGGLEIKIHA